MKEIFMTTAETVIDILRRSKKHYIVMRDTDDGHVVWITFYEVHRHYGKLLKTWHFCKGGIIQEGFAEVYGEEALLMEYSELLYKYEQGHYEHWRPELY